MKSVVNSIRRMCAVRVSTVAGALAIFLALGAAVASSAETVGIAGLNHPRVGHTGTTLANGGVLVAGGENAAGPVRACEIFDPVSRTFSLSGSLEAGRADHTATLLPDGRVFLIGGRISDMPLASTEIGNPDGRAFHAGPFLNLARSGHTATLLPDGRVVVVGGDAEGTIEVFDRVSGAFRLIDAKLATPRAFHAAALLHDGSILIAGGVAAAGGRTLASAEILDLATMTIRPAASDMGTPRSRFTMNVLPDGKVQAIGGDATVTMEMFNPAGGYFTARARLLGAPGALRAALNTPARSAVFGRSPSPDGASGVGDRALSARSRVTIIAPEALDRIGASVTRNPSAGFALATGGLRAQGTLSTDSVLTGDSSATVTTDKTDYQPGDTVVITGAGWLAGETVTMVAPPGRRRCRPHAHGGRRRCRQLRQLRFRRRRRAISAQRSFSRRRGRSSGYTAQTTFTDAAQLNLFGKRRRPAQPGEQPGRLGQHCTGDFPFPDLLKPPNRSYGEGRRSGLIRHPGLGARIFLGLRRRFHAFSPDNPVFFEWNTFQQPDHVHHYHDHDVSALRGNDLPRPASRNGNVGIGKPHRRLFLQVHGYGAGLLRPHDHRARERHCVHGSGRDDLRCDRIRRDVGNSDHQRRLHAAHRQPRSGREYIPCRRHDDHMDCHRFCGQDGDRDPEGHRHRQHRADDHRARCDHGLHRTGRDQLLGCRFRPRIADDGRQLSWSDHGHQ